MPDPTPSPIVVVLEGPFLIGTNKDNHFIVTTFGDLTVGGYNPPLAHFCTVGTWRISDEFPYGTFAPLKGQADILSIAMGATWTATLSRPATTDTFEKIVVASVTEGTPPGVYIGSGDPTVTFTEGVDRRLILPMPDSVTFGAQLTKVSITNTTTGEPANMSPYVVAVLQYNNDAESPVTLTLSTGQGSPTVTLDGTEHLIVKMTHASEMDMDMGADDDQMDLDHIENAFAELLTRVKGAGSAAALTLKATAQGTTTESIGPVNQYEMGVTPVPQPDESFKPMYNGQPNCGIGNIVVGR